MKKLLALGIAAALLTAGGAAPAAAEVAQTATGLGLRGESGLARTPVASVLPPLTLAVAGDFVAADDMYLPFRAEFGVMPGLEVGAHYWYLDVPGDDTAWGLNVKYLFPEVVPNLGLAVGGHIREQHIVDAKNDGYDFYVVASYPTGFIVPTLGIMFESIISGENESDFRLFGSLVANVLPNLAVGVEFMSSSDDLDERFYGDDDPDPAIWLGARFMPLEALTVQAGLLNYADYGNPDPGGMDDFIFHFGAQYSFSFAR